MFTRPLLSAIDRVCAFFDSYVDEYGLVSGFDYQQWQYVDWTKEWLPTAEFHDNGVPVAGRATNRYTFHTLLYVYALQHTAKLARWLGRDYAASEYEIKALRLSEAVRSHCYNGTHFLDTTVDACSTQVPCRSEHVQVFAILTGTAPPEEYRRLLADALDPSQGFSNCSYVMRFYTFRALSLSGMYEERWEESWTPWRTMLAENLSTWQEDATGLRSDCHAWGSIPLYEFPVEVAGLSPLQPGWTEVRWAPRTRLMDKVKASVPMGKSNVGVVEWGGDTATLILQQPVRLIVVLSDGVEEDRGLVAFAEVKLWYRPSACIVKELQWCRQS